MPDCEEYPEQDDNFYYMFGVLEPDCYGIIELDTGKTILLPPNIPEAYKIWMLVPDKEYFKRVYQVDDVIFADNIEDYFKSYKPQTVFLFNGVNSDSGVRPEQPNFPFLQNYNLNNTDIYKVINEQRVIKDETELKLLKHICAISVDAHLEIMRQVKEGLSEY